jgi:predicted transcriptional regulator of viral defense system
MKRDSADLRASLQRRAASQAGYFTAAQALQLGYSYPAQLYHERRGEWTRVDHGIYRYSTWPTTEHEDLVRWTLWSRTRGIVSHETALAVHGLGDVLPAKVHLAVPQTFRSKDSSVELHRLELPEQDVEDRNGFRVTTPIRSILDVAADMDPDRLAAVIGDGVEQGLITTGRLRRRAEDFGRTSEAAIDQAIRQERP